MITVPNALRPHIAFFGRRNAGKSSLVNRVTGQSLAVVSPQPGTTTDPVYKTMELLPAGPVVIIDTPGYDDEGALGNLRVGKTREILSRTDLAVLVMDISSAPDKVTTHTLGPSDKALLDEFTSRRIPYLLVFNKCDLIETASHPPMGTGERHSANAPEAGATSTKLRSALTGAGSTSTDSFNPAPESVSTLWVSAHTGAGITELKETIAAALAAAAHSCAQRPLVADMIRPGDQIVLVIPIDESAPKGRLILPQQQVLREALEAGGLVTCCRPQELARTIQALSAPTLVITDSQAFRQVAEILPEDMPLTSFSILMARYKGFLNTAMDGIDTIDNLQDGDCILIAEGCTHHRQCNDIGTVKIPRWLREHSSAEFFFNTVSGREFPEDITPYRVVIHCGGCMLTEREIQSRMERAVSQGVPFLNYGVLIAHMNGILDRSIAPLP